MYSLAAGGTGVNVEKLVGIIIHHPQDVGVTCYEDVGFEGFEVRFHTLLVVTGVASDVGHEKVEVLPAKELCFRDNSAQFPCVGIAIYGDDWLEFLESLEDIHTDVAGVPQLIAFAEKCIDLVGNIAVGVGKYANFNHDKHIKLFTLNYFCTFAKFCKDTKKKKSVK